MVSVTFSRCPHCRKKYKSVTGLRSHLEKDHPEQPMKIGDQTEDGVHNYTVSYITLCLLRLTLKDAVRRADGDLVMSVYRYVWCRIYYISG